MAPDELPHLILMDIQLPADAMVLYCKAFSKATDVTSATMTGVDRYGFEMSAKTSEGPRPVRLAFARPVSTPDEVRAALVAMVKERQVHVGLTRVRRLASRSSMRVRLRARASTH